jgi:hypothetical protein
MLDKKDTKKKSLKVSNLFYQDRGRFEAFWDGVKVAPEPEPVPEGTYVAIVKDGHVFKARTGTVGYKITFEITDGVYRGRTVAHNSWITADAASRSKFFLSKVGLYRLNDLDRPIPSGLRAQISVIEKGVGRRSYSEVDDFEVESAMPQERSQVRTTSSGSGFDPRNSGARSCEDDIDACLPVDPNDEF